MKKYLVLAIVVFPLMIYSLCTDGPNEGEFLYGCNQISTNKSHEILLIDLVKESLQKATLRESKLLGSIFHFRATPIGHLLNNLCTLPGMRYIQSGLYDGDDFVAALFENGGLASKEAIKLLTGERVFASFTRKCHTYLRALYYPVCLQTNQLTPLMFNIYFCNLPSRHPVMPKEILQSIHYALSPTFVLVINEWELASVRQEFFQAFECLNYRFISENYMRTSEQHMTYIAIIRKQDCIVDDIVH